jgi:hypothetical protein
LIIFSDYGAYHKERQFAFDDVDNVWQPGIHYVSQYKETEYSLRQYSNCEYRGEARAAYGDNSINLFVFNHFYPESCAHNYGYSYWETILGMVQKDCDYVNAYKVIMGRIRSCLVAGLFPNFVAVDFVEKGDLGGAREVVRTLNIIGKDTLLEEVLVAPTTTNNKNRSEL